MVSFFCSGSFYFLNVTWRNKPIFPGKLTSIFNLLYCSNSKTIGPLQCFEWMSISIYFVCVFYWKYNKYIVNISFMKLMWGSFISDHKMCGNIINTIELISSVFCGTTKFVNKCKVIIQAQCGPIKLLNLFLMLMKTCFCKNFYLSVNNVL